MPSSEISLTWKSSGLRDEHQRAHAPSSTSSEAEAMLASLLVAEVVLLLLLRRRSRVSLRGRAHGDRRS